MNPFQELADAIRSRREHRPSLGALQAPARDAAPDAVELGEEDSFMTVDVLNHIFDTPLIFDAGGNKLMIQTGTLVVDVRGTAEREYTRARLSYPVLQLPPGVGDGVVYNWRVHAVASVTPAGTLYSPDTAQGTTADGGWLTASGQVNINGTAANGYVSVGGFVSLPVSAGGNGTASVPIAWAGWSVDRVSAVPTGNHVDLLAEIAVLSTARLLRLAYSMFVTLSPLTTADHAGGPLGIQG